MAMRFEGVYFWDAPSEAQNGKVRLDIRSLGGKVSDCEHFVIIRLPCRLEAKGVKHGTLASASEGC